VRVNRSGSKGGVLGVPSSGLWYGDGGRSSDFFADRRVTSIESVFSSFPLGVVSIVSFATQAGLHLTSNYMERVGVSSSFWFVLLSALGFSSLSTCCHSFLAVRVSIFQVFTW
jgi:hypothetical protein